MHAKNAAFASADTGVKQRAWSQCQEHRIRKCGVPLLQGFQKLAEIQLVFQKISFTKTSGNPIESVVYLVGQKTQLDCGPQGLG